MQIAYVTETWPPEINGVALTASRTVAFLRARGHVVRLFRPRRAGEVDGEGAEPGSRPWAGASPVGPSDSASSARPVHDDVERVPGVPVPFYRGLRMGLPVCARLRAAWQVARPDLVHVATEGPLGWAAVRVARGMGIPVTSDFRTRFDLYSRHYVGGHWVAELTRRYLFAFHDRTDRTFVPTTALADELRAAGVHDVAVSARGVDTRQFTPARRSESLRRAWLLGGHAKDVQAPRSSPADVPRLAAATPPGHGWSGLERTTEPDLVGVARLLDPDGGGARAWGAAGGAAALHRSGGPVVLYVGRLASEKNLGLLLQAWRDIRAERPSARLVLVGDGPMRERLLRDCPEAVHAGPLTGETLAAHYASADLFLFPSMSETFGNVVLEAMASGLPVVAFGSGAAATCLRTGVEGWTVPRGDAAAFREAALRLALDPALRLRLGAAARVAAIGHSWDAVLEAFERSLLVVAGRGSGLGSGSRPVVR